MKVVVDNDEIKDSALPAVIIANVRSGGTFLSHCLSTHPQIFCDRGESLHHLSLWHTHLTADRVQLLHCLTHMTGWRVSMCKLTYNNTFQPKVWAYLAKTRPHVIHLTRRNVIRQSVSALIKTCELKRINPQPLSKILSNWQEVRQAIQASEFAEFVKDEPDGD